MTTCRMTGTSGWMGAHKAGDQQHVVGVLRHYLAAGLGTQPL